MKEIPLTKGQFAIVDDDDFEYLSQWKWCYSEGRRGDSGYAARRLRKADGDDHKKIVYLHRVIAKATEDQIVDHINRNRMDNRRANLRIVSPQHNVINRPIHKRNKTGVKGVYVNSAGKYVVNISVNNRTKYLGTFDTLEDAEKCRESGCVQFYGVYHKN